ncbi:MAG: hypothetical protein RLZZ196_3521 [Bacteroidota bacterium]|jgi:hypothetical protein
MKGHENAQPVKMIFLDTKEETIFKSVAYAKRITGIVEYQIKQSMNPLNKKRFTYQNRLITFRIVK